MASSCLMFPHHHLHESSDSQKLVKGSLSFGPNLPFQSHPVSHVICTPAGFVGLLFLCKMLDPRSQWFIPFLVSSILPWPVPYTCSSTTGPEGQGVCFVFCVYVCS